MISDGDMMQLFDQMVLVPVLLAEHRRIRFTEFKRDAVELARNQVLFARAVVGSHLRGRRAVHL